MNYAFKNLLTASPMHNSNKEIIVWWEKRRALYNLIMLVAGCITILLAVSLNEIAFTDLINVLPPILIVAASANIFYTLGWIIEIIYRRLNNGKETIYNVSSILFIGGIILSVFFTLAIDTAILVAFFFGS